MNQVLYNGAVYEANSLDMHQAGKLFSRQLSLIETLLYDHGRMPYWMAHGRRIRKSFQALGWLLPERLLTIISDGIVRLLAIQPLDTAKIRLRLLQQGGRIHYWLEASPMPEEQRPLRVGTAQGIAVAAGRLSFLKSNDRRVYLVAARQASSLGYQDMLLLNEAGRIVESTIANVFWEKDGRLFTPPLTEGCVAGVYREGLLSGAIPFKDRPVSEQVLTIREAQQADALYLTNAIRGMRKIDEWTSEEYP